MFIFYFSWKIRFNFMNVFFWHYDFLLHLYHISIFQPKLSSGSPWISVKRQQNWYIIDFPYVKKYIFWKFTQFTIQCSENFRQIKQTLKKHFFFFSELQLITVFSSFNSRFLYELKHKVLKPYVRFSIFISVSLLSKFHFCSTKKCRTLSL